MRSRLGGGVRSRTGRLDVDARPGNSDSKFNRLSVVGEVLGRRFNGNRLDGNRRRPFVAAVLNRLVVEGALLVERLNGGAVVDGDAAPTARADTVTPVQRSDDIG